MKSDLSRWYDEALQQVARVGKDMFGVDKTEDLVLSQIARGLLGRPDCLPPDGKTELRVRACCSLCARWRKRRDPSVQAARAWR